LQKTVLVIDDDADIRNVLRYVLEDEGYLVREAADGIAGLASVEAFRPQLILLDLNMPGLDGWGMCAQMDMRKTSVPTVIMTAGRSSATEATRLGVAGSLAKPFEIADVLATVSRLAITA
jgi:DNA-binding response OmpR family regulator